MRLNLTLLCMIFSSFFISTAHADMDCGNETIRKDISNNIDGEWTMEKVRSICGNPTKIKNWTDEIINKTQNPTQNEYIKTNIHYSLWTYDRGGQTFVEDLLFRENILIDIKDSDHYGSE